jgi:hypothetical protein
MLKKVKTALSYVVRPRTYPFLLRRASELLTGATDRLENSRAKAEAWCRRRATEPTRALASLGLNPTVLSVRGAFPDVFAAADARVAACPFPMGGGAGLDFLYACALAVGANRVVVAGSDFGPS